MQTYPVRNHTVLTANQGTALSLDQYNALLTAAPLLESVLSKKDAQIARSDYDSEPTAAEPGDEKEKRLEAATKVDEHEE